MALSELAATVYITDPQESTFSCPHCADLRFVPGPNHRSPTGHSEVQCGCGQKVTIIDESRRAARYSVRLFGSYKRQGAEETESMIVSSLSLTGMSFRSLLPPSLAIGDGIVVSFLLADQDQTAVEIEATTRWIQQRAVGAMFDPDHAVVAELAAYLGSL